MARPGVFDSAWFEHNKQAVESATKGTPAWALVHLYRWLNDMEHHGWDVELEREALAILARENQSAATPGGTP